MLQYLFYFLIGGAVVASVAYVGSRGNAIVTGIVANLPILFMLNVFLIYRVGGINGSLAYAKGSLLLLPLFVFCAALTIWLLPRLEMPRALMPALGIYLLAVIIITTVRNKLSMKKDEKVMPSQPPETTERCSDLDQQSRDNL